MYRTVSLCLSLTTDPQVTGPDLSANAKALQTEAKSVNLNIILRRRIATQDTIQNKQSNDNKKLYRQLCYLSFPDTMHY
jgi:hypothetical protein